MQMKSLSEIAVGLIANIHDTLPSVDTKEGTFIRDVFIDPVSSEIADLYQELKLMELSQSIITATGDDLDRLAKNFFITRKDATYATGKLRFYIGPNEPTDDIYVPDSATVGTPGDASTDPLEYELSEPINILVDDPGTYSREEDTGLYYVDIEASSTEPGSIYNIDAGTITLLGDVVDTEIQSVTNLFPFTGGTDDESDASLMMRVSMAITGVNIGTKDGYKSFIMRQSEVEDAIVVGAGDALMERDKDKDGNHQGGMVDIYVRSQTSEEHSMNFDVDYEYVNDTINGDAYKPIILSKQPVLSIEKIIGTSSDGTQKTYVNGSNYKKEKGSDRYYRDVIWVYDTIVTDGMSGDELLKAQATNTISQLLKNVNYLQDIKYDIDWHSIDPYNDYNVLTDPNFYRGYYNGDGLIYMIATKKVDTNRFIEGRRFIRRDGEIYERTYYYPDFEIEEDTSPSARSINAKNAIKWIPNTTRDNLPKIGESLSINYTFNSAISSLQDKLDSKRIMTADVLLKQAIEIPVEIKMEVVPQSGYSTDTIRNSIVENITNYINDIKKLGGSIDRSDLVFIARGAEGVDTVNLDKDKIHLSVLDDVPQSKITLKDLEYMKLESIYIKVLPEGTLV